MKLLALLLWACCALGAIAAHGSGNQIEEESAAIQAAVYFAAVCILNTRERP